MNGTTLELISTSDGREMTKIKNSRWITLQDMKLHFEDDTSTATKAMEISGSRDVTLERIHFHAERPDTKSIGYPHGLLVRNSSSQIFISDSRFHSSGRGLVFQDCDDCWVSGSWFGSMEKSGINPSLVLAEKRGPGVVRFANNTFDLNSSASTMLALTLEREEVEPSVFEGGVGAQVVGNSFVNIQDTSGGDKHYALRLYGYAGANISGNTFKCKEEGNCQWGIRFSNADCSGANCNERNLIVGNQFIDYTELPGDSDCAIWLSDTNANPDPVNNLVANNLVTIRDNGGSNVGVCGNTSNNQVSGNAVFVVP